MNVTWFDERKAAQVAAYFARKESGQIDILKLVKLIYLSDRKNMERNGHPIINDKFVSMPHGPVNSMTLNYINGAVDHAEEWDKYISDRAGYTVATAKEFDIDDFDELSDTDLETLDAVWKECGNMTKWEIRDWTHEHCPEWEYPQGGAEPIPHERVFKFLGFENANELASQVKIERGIDELFASLRR